MRDYKFKFSEDTPMYQVEEKGCRCSVAVGFLLVLLAAVVAVGVGIIVHFAGNKGDVTCNYNLEGLAVSEANILQCAGLAAGNNRNICDACPKDTVSTTSPPINVSTTQSSTLPPVDLSRLPLTFKPLVYTVFLQPEIYSQNTSDFRASGNVSILVSCQENSAEVILHAVDMELTGGITVTEVSTAEDIFQSHAFNSVFGTVTITTSRLMLKGRNYTISFQGFTYPLRTDFIGFFYTWYENNGEKIYQAHTDLETSETRRVFPCFDEPAFKAVFDITVARKTNKISLTNGELDRTVQGPDDWVYDVFKSSPVMSTYLLHVVVCDYLYTEANSSNGVKMKFWTRPQAVNQTEFAMNLTSRVLTLFETYFNIPYPMDKMGLFGSRQKLLLANSGDPDQTPQYAASDLSLHCLHSIAYLQYLWTAMENWGIIVYREDVFLIDELKGSYLDKINAALVISHEVAHNWFGNLVSPAWWDDLWLNEGFATYGEFLGADLAEPTWKFADFLAYEATVKAMKVDGLMTSHPLHIPGVTDLGKIMGYFDSITYKKGCALIKMMEFFVGKETFRKGLENYLKSLSYGNANHNDLWLAIGEQAMLDNKTITEVKDIMNIWIGQMNYPVVDVEWEVTGRIRLTQRRYLENPNGTDPGIFISAYGYKWYIPFTYTSSTEMKFDKDEKSILMMEPQDASVAVASDKIPSPDSNNWIIGNLKFLGYYLVNYDERNWNALMDQLINDHKAIDATNRVQIIHDTWALARSGDLSLDIPLRLFDYIASEDEMAPWFAFADEAVTLQRLLFTHPIYGMFQMKMRSVLERVTTPNTTNQDIISSGVKDKQVYLACLFETESCISEAKMAFNNMNDTRIDPTLSDTYYCTAVRNGGAEAYDIIYNKLKHENNLAERLRLLKALTCSRHRWLLARTTSIMKDENQVYYNELYRVVHFMALNRDALPVVWEFYRDNFNTVMTRSGGFWGQQPILDIANSLNTIRQLQELKEFTAENKMQGSQFFQQAEEKLRGAQDIAEKGSQLFPAVQRKGQIISVAVHQYQKTTLLTMKPYESRF